MSRSRVNSSGDGSVAPAFSRRKKCDVTRTLTVGTFCGHAAQNTASGARSQLRAPVSSKVSNARRKTASAGGGGRGRRPALGPRQYPPPSLYWRRPSAGIGHQVKTVRPVFNRYWRSRPSNGKGIGFDVYSTSSRLSARSYRALRGCVSVVRSFSARIALARVTLGPIASCPVRCISVRTSPSQSRRAPGGTMHNKSHIASSMQRRDARERGQRLGGGHLPKP